MPFLFSSSALSHLQSLSVSILSNSVKVDAVIMFVQNVSLRLVHTCEISRRINIRNLNIKGKTKENQMCDEVEQFHTSIPLSFLCYLNFLCSCFWLSRKCEPVFSLTANNSYRKLFTLPGDPYLEEQKPFW